MAVWGNCVSGGAATISCLEPLFQNVVTALVEFVGVVLFIILIVGGYNFLFAGGDAKKMEKAKGTISSAIVGLVVVVVAYLIILFISNFTGIADILEFKVNTGGGGSGGNSNIPNPVQRSVPNAPPVMQ